MKYYRIRHHRVYSAGKIMRDHVVYSAVSDHMEYYRMRDHMVYSAYNRMGDHMVYSE